MKHRTARLSVLLLLSLALGGCGDDAATGFAPVGGGGGAAQTATSTLCEGLSGGEAILWDLYNGVVRTDAGLPPAIPSPNLAYAHPSFPALGFFYPTGWTPETIDGGIHDLGVNLLRDDQTAIWRQQTSTTPGAPLPGDVRAIELDTLRTFFGLQNDAVDRVCFTEATFDAGGGIPVSTSNALYRIGEQTVVVVTSVTSFAGTGSSSVRRQVVSAPTSEFPNRALDTFLAIDFQMLVGDSRNLFDRDGDGWRDGVDAAPDDPTRH